VRQAARQIRNKSEQCGKIKAYTPLLRFAVYSLYNKNPQQVVEQTASRTGSWTTCRTASRQQ